MEFRVLPADAPERQQLARWYHAEWGRDAGLSLEQELQRRWPTRFVPHYTMVTFLHTPYAEALRRTELQRDMLVAATAGHDSLDNIDWTALEAQIHAQLPVLEGAH